MPQHYDLVLWLVQLAKVLWVFTFGACVGSLVNVLVYRLPRGLGVVMPASRCTSCGTHLTWRENIPVFGWLFLGGKCRFCRSPISAEYPIVEAAVGLLFSLTYLACYAENGRFLGIPFDAVQPEWARSGFGDTWPTFVVTLVLFGCTAAMTLVDAKTYQIPMVLTWAPAALALVAHPLHALWISHGNHPFFTTARGWEWTIATPGPANWWWIGASLGGGTGVVLANILLATGVFTRSFADYPEWEKKVLAEAERQNLPPSDADPVTPSHESAGVAPAPEPAPPADLWIQYPHARREMLRELIFIAPIVGLALVGGAVAMRLAGPWTPNPDTLSLMPSRYAPLWLDALAGALMGYLVGGGLVWGVRIFGSLGFGKEAMGLGDVHMLAAIGACLGWIDGVFTFFVGTLVGVLWALLGGLLGGAFRRAMPFGPFLGVACVLVWFGKPWIERGFTVLVGGLHPFNFP